MLQKKSLFWDIDTSRLDLNENGNFVIKRILNFGDIEDFQWAKKYYGEEQIKQTVKQGVLDTKSQYFWQQYFNLTASECTPNPLKKIQSLFWRR